MIEPPRNGEFYNIEFETFETVKDQSSDDLHRPKIVCLGNLFAVFELI